MMSTVSNGFSRPFKK